MRVRFPAANCVSRHIPGHFARHAARHLARDRRFDDTISRHAIYLAIDGLSIGVGGHYVTQRSARPGETSAFALPSLAAQLGRPSMSCATLRHGEEADDMMTYRAGACALFMLARRFHYYGPMAIITHGDAAAGQDAIWPRRSIDDDMADFACFQAAKICAAAKMPPRRRGFIYTQRTRARRRHTITTILEISLCYYITKLISSLCLGISISTFSYDISSAGGTMALDLSRYQPLKGYKRRSLAIFCFLMANILDFLFSSQR